MGYMYDMLKKSLGESKFTTSYVGVIKDYSPNSIKAIFIARNCIMICYHIKQPKIYNLDVQESSFDISRNSSNGALHNLLSQRQLSCLEEIYVDSVFQNYLNIMNLPMYVGKLVKDTSRLRYWGYIENFNPIEAEMYYIEALSKENYSYSYAEDNRRSSKVQFTFTNNRFWYKKYNLRPQFYSLDSDNGNLARWFKRCEEKIKETIETHEIYVKQSEKFNVIYNLFLRDVERVPDLQLLMRIRKYTGRYKDNKLLSTVYKVIDDRLKESFCVRNFKVKDLQSSVQSKTNEITEYDKYILGAYKNLGVFDIQSKEEFTLDDLNEYKEKNDGFLQLTEVLEDICCSLFRNKTTQMNMVIGFSVSAKNIPKGDFRKLMPMKINEYSTGTRAYKGYLDIILGICGFDESAFIKRYNDIWSI